MSRKLPPNSRRSSAGKPLSEQLEERLWSAFLRVMRRLPYALQARLFYGDIIGCSLDWSATWILNLGSGEGRIAHQTNQRSKPHWVNLDLFLPYLRTCRIEVPDADCILADAKHLPIKEKSFDVVMCLELIEHLAKIDGLRLIGEMQRIAREQVIVSTPTRFHEVHIFDNNPLQIHRSGWSPAEFRRLAFKVRGTTGLRHLRGERAGSIFRHPFMKSLNSILTYVTQVFTYFVPDLAWGMVCVKCASPRPAESRTGRRGAALQNSVNSDTPPLAGWN